MAVIAEAEDEVRVGGELEVRGVGWEDAVYIGDGLAYRSGGGDYFLLRVCFI